MAIIFTELFLPSVEWPFNIGAIVVEENNPDKNTRGNRYCILLFNQLNLACFNKRRFRYIC